MLKFAFSKLRDTYNPDLITAMYSQTVKFLKARKGRKKLKKTYKICKFKRCVVTCIKNGPIRLFSCNRPYVVTPCVFVTSITSQTIPSIWKPELGEPYITTTSKPVGKTIREEECMKVACSKRSDCDR